jgi:hypothetical protein
MRSLKVPSLFLVALLAGCANLTFDQKLQNGYDLNVSVRDAATLSLNAGRLTSEQGTEVLEITDRTRLLLDTAATGDERGLNLALEILQAIEKETP